MRILEIIANAGDGVGVTAIAKQLDLTKSGIFRHLQTLLQSGYIVQDAASAGYRLGSRIFALARRVPARGNLAALAEKPMRDLRDAFGLSVVLGSPTPRGIFVLSTMASTTTIEIGVRAGSEIPLHASAQGRIALAFGHASLSRDLRKIKLEAITPATIVDHDQLDSEIAATRKRGFATAPGEVLAGINALAVPILEPDGELAGSLAIVGSIQHVPADADAEMVKSLKHAAHAIEMGLKRRLQ